MLEWLDRFHLDVIVGIGVPAVGATFFIVRHFWMKSKCFALLQHRVENQDRELVINRKEHKEMLDRLNKIDRNISALQAQNKIILDKVG